jgi:xylan 1,4-beta-xylosidase
MRGGLAILLWNYHDDDLPGPVARITLEVAGKHGGRARLWRVDETHGNAFGAWKRMGSPASPDSAQIAALKRASRISPEPVAARDGTLSLTIPRQGVALIELDP